MTDESKCKKRVFRNEDSKKEVKSSCCTQKKIVGVQETKTVICIVHAVPPLLEGAWHKGKVPEVTPSGT